MDMLINQVAKTEGMSFAFYMTGQSDLEHPVSTECDVIVLPMFENKFHVLPGDDHPEAPSFMRWYAEIVRTIAPPCDLIGGPRIMIHKAGRHFSSRPSHLHYARRQVPGSDYITRNPIILISTMLTPKRLPSYGTSSSGQLIDSHKRPVTNLIGEEQVLRQSAFWTIAEADRIWPGDDEFPPWSTRVYASLREDQDVSRLEPELPPTEQIADAFVQFALCFFQNSALARFAVMDDDVPFHTREFARMVTGFLGREIVGHANHLWSRR